jgi:hypothetical protein
VAAEWLSCAIIIAVCSPAFGHFETVRPLWTSVLRWLVHLAITAVIGVTLGRPGGVGEQAPVRVWSATRIVTFWWAWIRPSAILFPTALRSGSLAQGLRAADR